MIKLAEISPDGKYRYWLSRSWDSTRVVNFIMLNPSTADATLDDPTIRKCIGFAQRWGFGGIEVTNLFAWRATNPKELKHVVDPVGQENDYWIIKIARSADLVVCAWGVDGAIRNRHSFVQALIDKPDKPLHYIRLGKTQPCHPLYLPYELKPQSWAL